MWRLNPTARAAFAAMGGWAIALMAAVSAACATAAVGLWRMASWGRRWAIGILAVNLAGDLGNGLIRGDHRALFGVPVAVALLAYLGSAGVRRVFSAAPDL
jgi:hypothetical protein